MDPEVLVIAPLTVISPFPRPSPVVPPVAIVTLLEVSALEMLVGEIVLVAVDV